MLEDLAMDKKPSNRPIQNSTKGSGIENKKVQDVTTKQFPKSSRRREPNSNGRLEQGRKPVSQKSKTLDKRPRPRGQYYGGGKESAQVEECGDELGSLYSSGSKKQNLNHLLNFHYAPRGETAHSGPKPSYQYGVRWLMSTQKHKYNKEHFLQANCQFVVRADADYTLYLADPDHLVNWEFIEQIKVASVEPMNCPICLSTPVAAKMTRCGHIYCFPCLLHYLALSDKTWRKCPICYEAVHKNDLKSVQVNSVKGYSVGQEITFQLMTRERGSLMACPVAQFDVRTNHKPVLNISEKQLDTVFAKLLKADKTEVLNMIEKEINELELEKADNKGCPELCFIEQALDMCAQRKLNLEQKVNEIMQVKQGQEECIKKDFISDIHNLNFFSENAVACESAFDNFASDANKNVKQNKENAAGVEANDRLHRESMSSEGEDLSPTTITAEDLEVLTPHQHTAQAKQFYFYQASDGQQIYLHAVNVQMLEMMYGSLAASPPSLTGLIVEKEAGSMTVELRRRLRYLQHLPVTAQFEVAEIELRPPVISSEILDAFSDQLEQRKRRRLKRDREERKREKKIAEVELRQMGRHSIPRLRLDSFHHFPQCGIPEDEIPPPPLRAASAGSSRASSPNSHRSASPAIAALALEQDSSPSFAQMLRSSKTVVNGAWPGIGGRVRDLSPPRAETVTVDSDGEVAPAPRYRQSFSDAIAAALENASIQPGFIKHAQLYAEGTRIFYKNSSALKLLRNTLKKPIEVMIKRILRSQDHDKRWF